MTRRLTVAMVAVVVATLVVAGVATVALTQARATRATEARLADQVEDLVGGAGTLDQFFDRMAAARARARAGGAEGGRLAPSRPDRLADAEACPLRPLVRALRVRDAACVLVNGDGTITVGAGGATAPIPGRLDHAALAAGETLSGSSRGTAWAAKAWRPEAATTAEDLPAVVLTRNVTSELAPVRRWLVLAAVITLALGAGVAVVLGRRLARPLVAAERATSRIAAGDLTTRLPEAAGDDELVRLTRAINELAASLERSRRLEQQFLLSVSHDLRTPLTSIRGYADALADGTLTDVGRGAAVIQREATRLERLVRDLLDLARLDADQFRFQLDAVDLADVARRAVEAFGPDAEREGIRLELRTPAEEAGTVPLVADRDRLAQVVANLVENALKFAAGRIDVAVGSSDGWAWLMVGDDGPGIAAEDLPHVFERLFVAGGRPARRQSGAGLGLAIARELVVAQGGTVSAEPRAAADGGGTQMIVRLPLAPSPTRPATAGAGAATVGPDPSATAAAAAPPGPGPDRRPTPR